MDKLEVTAGAISLAQWQAVYHGARLTLDAEAMPRVRAAAHTVARIVAKGEAVYGVNTGFGKLAHVRIAPENVVRLQRNIVLSHAAGVGEPMPLPIVRLMLALKLASLGQGASGVQVHTISAMSTLLAHDVMPVVPAQGSVGASGDLAPLAHMAAALMGVGEMLVDNKRVPAEKALTQLGLAPLTFVAKEGLALLNGTQFCTAYALAALFETNKAWQHGLVTGALSTEAAKGSDTPFDPRIHVLRRQPGQIGAAQTLRQLLVNSEIRASHYSEDPRVQDPYCLRCQPQVMGAAFDIMHNAARTLDNEANGVSDNPLVFPETDAVISGGNFHAEPVAFAADTLAMALCEIGALSERRVAMLVDPAISGLPAFLTPNPGLNSGFMLPQVTAAALVSENKQCAYPASVDSIPTCANQEDHVSMAAHGARRLLPMASNVHRILGIELLAAAQGCDFHAPLVSSRPLEAVRALVREHVPHLDEDRHIYPDLLKGCALIEQAHITRCVEAAGVPLPSALAYAI